MIPKLRAWHKQFKLMKRVRKLDLDYDRVFVAVDSSKRQRTDINCTSWNFNNIAIMQWTGLQDCNGNDIYEGDIVSFELDKFGEEVAVAKIYWDKERAAFCVDYWDPYYAENLLTAFRYSGQKVVGNIYENSELLNE